MANNMSSLSDIVTMLMILLMIPFMLEIMSTIMNMMMHMSHMAQLEEAQLEKMQNMPFPYMPMKQQQLPIYAQHPWAVTLAPAQRQEKKQQQVPQPPHTETAEQVTRTVEKAERHEEKHREIRSGVPAKRPERHTPHVTHHVEHHVTLPSWVALLPPPPPVSVPHTAKAEAVTQQVKHAQQTVTTPTHMFTFFAL